MNDPLTTLEIVALPLIVIGVLFDISGCVALVRLPLAVVLVVWGARTDRRWTVVVSAMLALPVLWFAAPALLIGVMPEIRAKREAEKRAAARAVHGGPATAVPD